MFTASDYIIRVPKARTLLPKHHEILEKYQLSRSRTSLAYTSSGKPRNLLGTSTKVEKGEKKGWLTKVMYLQPHVNSGFNTCPNATEACSRACLIQNGNFRFHATARATFAKTFLWFFHPEYFINRLIMEVLQFGIESNMSDKLGAIRLNGTSDIKFYEYINFDKLSNVTGIKFYDYTKNPYRPTTRMPDPKNYSFTFSISEHEQSWQRAQKWIDAGFSAAMVVAALGSKRLKDAKAAQELICDRGFFDLLGKRYPTIHGDNDDLRMLDQQGSLVILHAKNKALADTTSFVTRVSL